MGVIHSHERQALVDLFDDPLRCGDASKAYQGVTTEAGRHHCSFSLGLSIPNFWQALLMILVFGVWLGWLPIRRRRPSKCLPMATMSRFIGYAAAPGLDGGVEAAVSRQWQRVISVSYWEPVPLTGVFFVGVFAWPGVAYSSINQQDLLVFRLLLITVFGYLLVDIALAIRGYGSDVWSSRQGAP